MENLLTPPVIIVLIVAFVLGFMALGLWLERKRAADMLAFARTRRYAYAETDSLLLTANFKALTHGRNQKIKNVLRGTRGDIEFAMCDFEYVTGTGKNRRTNRTSLCFVKTAGRTAPPFYLRRQMALFDAIGKMFGGQDINFADDPTFSKAYILQSSHEEGALRRFMGPRVRAELMRLKDKKWVIENLGDYLLIDSGRRAKVHQHDALLADALALRATWT